MSAAVTPAKRAYGNDVLLLHSGDAGACERNLAKIAGFLGAKVQMSRVDGNVNELADLLTVQGDRSICVMINADVLVRTAHGGSERSGKQHPLRGLPANTLVYGWKPSNEHAHSLRVLTNGTLAAVTQLSPGSLPIEVGCDSACRQLAGLKFDVGQAEAPCIFESGAGAMLCERLISIGGGVSFARLRDEEGSSLLLAAGEVGDLDAAVSGSDSILQYTNAIVPAMIAIRECLYPYVWHNEAPSACLIVDDPLLKPRYGALDYRKHLAVMDSRKFTTSIAFIPWNHRRTDRRVADLFRSRPDAFSLCIHGCDHTRAEFGDADAAVLRQRASLALERMRSHRALWRCSIRRSDGVSTGDLLNGSHDRAPGERVPGCGQQHTGADRHRRIAATPRRAGCCGDSILWLSIVHTAIPFSAGRAGVRSFSWETCVYRGACRLFSRRLRVAERDAR